MAARRLIRRGTLATAIVVIAAGSALIAAPERAGALNASTTVLASVPHNQVDGYPVVLKATVRTPRGTPAATGTVEYFEGVTSLGTAPVVNKVAQLSYVLPLGTHFVHANYSGDGNTAPSTSNTPKIIVGNQSLVNVDLLYKSPTGLPVPSWTASTPVLFTAQIVVKVGQVNYGPRTGTATVNIDGTLHQVTVKNSRIVYLASSGLGLGDHVITATYHGDIHYKADSSISRHITVSNP